MPGLMRDEQCLPWVQAGCVPRSDDDICRGPETGEWQHECPTLTILLDTL